MHRRLSKAKEHIEYSLGERTDVFELFSEVIRDRVVWLLIFHLRGEGGQKRVVTHPQWRVVPTA